MPGTSQSNSLISVPLPPSKMQPARPNEILLAAEAQWIFTEDELLRTPSALDGMPPEKERENRGKGVNFIIQVGIMLKLPQLTLATASVFLHRFFMRYSMVDLPGRPGLHYYAIAATALFLATKVEENCRKMRELVIACCRVAQKNPNLVIDEQSKEYWRWRDTILHNEDVLLESLCFDLSLEAPYKTLYDFLMCFGEGDNKKLRNAAWAFVNDSNLTMLCLLFTSRSIAAAALYAAAKHCDVAFPDDAAGRPWWTVLGVELKNVKKACNYMAGVYENSPLKGGDGGRMYMRTPEDGDETLAKTRRMAENKDISPTPDAKSPSLRASSVASSERMVKRPRHEEKPENGTNGDSTIAGHEGQATDDIPWAGETSAGRDTKRQKIEVNVDGGNGKAEQLANGRAKPTESSAENGPAGAQEESLSEEGEVEP